MRPTEDYLPHFQPTLLKARLAANTAATLASVPDSHLSDAMPALLAGDYVTDDVAPPASRMTRQQVADIESAGVATQWQPECDPYRGLGYWDMADHVLGIEEEDGGGGLQAEDAEGHQSFLCHQAAALLGRHAQAVHPSPLGRPPTHTHTHTCTYQSFLTSPRVNPLWDAPSPKPDLTFDTLGPKLESPHHALAGLPWGRS